MNSPLLPRPLVMTFNRHGHTITQSLRTALSAVYQVSDTLTGQLLGYEVVVIRTVKESNLPGGKVAPFREVYPGDEDFGRTGWHFPATDRLQAMAKFQSLVHGKAV